MAHVVGFVGQKGGTGKSGTAQAFAVAAAREASNVLIADLDTDQQTSVEWGKQRLANGFEPLVHVKAVPRLRVFDLVGSCDVLVIDAPGWADDLSVWLAKGCHLTVLPSKPTVEDLNPTIRLLHELRAKGLDDYRSVVALNEVLQDKEVDFAREHLASQGFTALPGYMRAMKSFRDVRTIGKAWTETTSAALNKEAMKLVKAITTALELSEREMAKKPKEPALARVNLGKDRSR
jgi:chromosome partitioning protein